MSAAIRWPRVDCCSADDLGLDGCACGREERVLRAYVDHRIELPMTLQQREWCLQEIDQVEGYKRSEHQSSTDADLARTVLNAWRDYARDKGLL